MTADVDGWVHAPPMNSLSYSVFWLSVMAPTLPSPTRNENTFQSSGIAVRLRLQHQHQVAHQKLP
ncbi:hypothetical protein I553_1215 [Mycobacterium xenopi 4042]|uniref:Uncharacterized protein n=1 Tax=Mycobacterium xenopi 4042 TaxID=1299334 RepID=X7ZCD7_MYCXE|nr:hypothetical protein I553_1215 [Mycobacterium xenopi 4042]